MKTEIIICLVCLCSAAAADSFNPFAISVIDISLNGPNFPSHCPAPGQFINHPHFMNPNVALGAPDGNTIEPNLLSVVSLGGFGGQIVLAFDHDVEDNPANPMGLDAIVFGNALWMSNNPQLHWAEFGTIEIMPELNGNSICGDDPNEKWYLVVGSHLSDYETRLWERGDVNGYPLYTGWPDSYETGAYKLDPEFQIINGKIVFVNPNYQDADPCNDDLEGYYGFCDYNPTVKLGDRNADNDVEGYGDCPNMPPKLFYTIPDDPMTVGITAGSSGGDAFDIGWAVDEDTWQPADIESFRYIRITTAVDCILGRLGEVSTEIDSVADVRPMGDIDGDDDVGLTDLGLFTESWLSEWGQPNFNPAADLDVNNKIDLRDYALFAWGWANYR